MFTDPPDKDSKVDKIGIFISTADHFPDVAVFFDSDEANDKREK